MYKVLVVEDDPMVRMINEQYVRMNKDFCIASSVKNGQEALDYLKENKVDLVILDVFMPFMNGVEFLKKLREQKLKTEVIMVTAANDTATLEETMHLGVIDYLVKPFALERFQVALEKFTAKMNAISGSSVLDQNRIDSIISNSPHKKSKEYPKGIQEKTLHRIKSCFENKNGWQSVELIAEELGISIVTVRHYVNYLVKEGFLQESINYETGGRPSSLYKMT